MSRNQQVKGPSSDKPEDLQPKQRKVFFSLERIIIIKNTVHIEIEHPIKMTQIGGKRNT